MGEMLKRLVVVVVLLAAGCRGSEPQKAEPSATEPASAPKKPTLRTEPVSDLTREERHCELRQCIACSGNVMVHCDPEKNLTLREPAQKDTFDRCVAQGLDRCYDKAMQLKSESDTPAAGEKKARDLLEETCFAGHAKSCNALGEYWHLVVETNRTSPRGRPRHERAEAALKQRLYEEYGAKWKSVPSSADFYDITKPKCFYELACNDGLPEACLNYSNAPRTLLCEWLHKKIEYAERACAAGLIEGCEHLATMWEHGWREGKEEHKDLTLAREYHAKACERGSSESCYRLGVMWRDGQGGEADSAKARGYFERLCGYGKYHSKACEAIVELGIPNDDPI